MSAWDECRFWWRSRVWRKPPVPVPDDGGILEPLRPRVLLITYNPVIGSEGGRRLTQVLGWGDAEAFSNVLKK